MSKLTSRQVQQLAKEMAREAEAQSRRQQAAAAHAADVQRRQQEEAAAIRRQAILDHQNGGVRVKTDLRRRLLHRDLSSVVAAAGTDRPDLYWDNDHFQLGTLRLPGTFQNGMYKGPVLEPVADGWRKVEVKSQRALSMRLWLPHSELTKRWQALRALRAEMAQASAAEAERARNQHAAEVEAARRGIQVRREAEVLEQVVVQTECLGCGAPPPPRGQACRYCGTVAA